MEVGIGLVGEKIERRRSRGVGQGMGWGLVREATFVVWFCFFGSKVKVSIVRSRGRNLLDLKTFDAISDPQKVIKRLKRFRSPTVLGQHPGTNPHRLTHTGVATTSINKDMTQNY